MKENNKDMIILGIAFIVILVLAGIFALKNIKGSKGAKTESNQTQESSASNKDSQVESATSQTTDTAKKQYAKAPDMILETSKTYQAVLKTSKGDITLDLFADKMPITVNNFVFLAKEGFYDGTKFHRIIKDFMIQGGDPLGTGAGGPGYRFADEPFEGEYIAGTLAMANAGPNTNGSQFFIMHGKVDLPKSYTIFGKVADEAGMEVVDAIATTEVVSNPQTGENSKPVEDVVVSSVSIIVK
ncbi:MAG: peptidylprolyl isomerase [uncultured bacterium]|nr:MAG: peptidylprolyl isomerase [uncultured bacterium]